MNQDAQLKQQRAARESAEAFDRFMADPMTKLAVSMVPATPEHPELLRTLLRSCFDAGNAAGGGAMAGMFLDAMMPRSTPKT